MTISSSRSQPSKAPGPISRREAGSSTACSAEQRLNAQSEMLSSEAGRRMLSSDMQSAKALLSMVRKPFGKETSRSE